MAKVKTFTNYAIAYLAWIVSILLWLWFMLVSRDAVNGLSAYLIGTTFQGKLTLQAIDRFYLFFVGIAWLVVMILTEHYFRTGVEKKNVTKRVTRFLGIEIALIFIADAILLFLSGLEIATMSRWVIAIFELILAVGLLWIGYSKTRFVQRSKDL